MAYQRNHQPATTPNWQQLIQQHIQGLDYGAVEIVIHNSRIVQVDVTERIRVDSKRRNSSSLSLNDHHDGLTPKF